MNTNHWVILKSCFKLIRSLHKIKTESSKGGVGVESTWNGGHSIYSPRELWKVKRDKILSVRWPINGGFITGLKKRFKASYIVVWSKYAFDFLLFSSVKTSWKIEFISIRTWGGAYRGMHFLVLQVYGPRLVGLRFSRFSSPDYFLPCLISFAEHSGSNPVLCSVQCPK